MSRISISFTRKMAATEAVLDLACRVEAELGGPNHVAGGFLFATAAAGPGALEVGRALSDRWPHAVMAGTSFEGLLSAGQILQNEPALGFLAWSSDTREPAIALFGDESEDSERIADEILAAVDSKSLSPKDLVLLFPDANGRQPIEPTLSDLEVRLGGAAIAGAAASGVDAEPACVWTGHGEAQPGRWIGLVLPGGIGGMPSGDLVRASGASRISGEWLEVTSCRSRWIDRLDGVSALDGLRRELRLGEREPLEGYLDRILVRLRRRGHRMDRSHACEEGTESPYDEERYIVGIDERRGSFSMPITVDRGDHVAMAWPDALLARDGLRSSLEAMAPAAWLLQFACRARDAELHGDSDLEAAWVATHAGDRQVFGTIAPFQLGPNPSSEPAGAACLLIHSNVLAALNRS